MNIKRYDGENELSFIYRVCDAKTTQTWEEIGNYLNECLGKNNSSSAYRKAYQYTKKMVDANQDKFYDIDAQIEELEELKKEIELEKKKIQTLNIEKNRIDRQDARKELFYEQIGDCVKKLTPPNLEIVHIRNTNKKYIQTLADIHMGSEFASANNEYSSKIVKDRFEILKSETIKFIKEKGLEELTIVGLGDLVAGVLRLNDLRVNDSTVVKSSVQVAQIISAYLNDLSAYCEITYVDCVYGNHSQIRYLGSQANAMMNEDLGYIIGNYIKDSLVFNHRVKVILPKEDDLFVKVPNIFDYNILIGHGHQIKNINSAIKDLSMQRREFIDYLIIGHLHNDKNICSGEAYAFDVEVLIAPSIVGSDLYSDSIFKGSKSASAIYGFDEVFGHTETYKIILN